jgi:alpha-1,2-mannosyltransferase
VIRAMPSFTPPWALRQVGNVACFALPLFLLVGLVTRWDALLVDFHHAFIPAGNAVLHGHSPFPVHLPPRAPKTTPYVYPITAAWLYVPFSILPYSVASVLYVALEFAALAATLRVLGVRDARCYAVVCAWPAIILAVVVGTVGTFFPLMIALIWRWRKSDWIWLLLALMIAIKIFMWPLAFYLLATRRWRALGVTIAGTAAMVLVPWALIGFDDLLRYPRLLSALNAQEHGWSLGLPSLMTTLGLPAGTYVLIVAAIAAAAFRLRANHRALFTLCLLLCLAASPLVWMHYFVILLIPVALLSPRLSAVWFVPLITVLGIYPSLEAAPLSAFVEWWGAAGVITFLVLRETVQSWPRLSTA